MPLEYPRCRILVVTVPCFNRNERFFPRFHAFHGLKMADWRFIQTYTSFRARQLPPTRLKLIETVPKRMHARSRLSHTGSTIQTPAIIFVRRKKRQTKRPVKHKTRFFSQKLQSHHCKSISEQPSFLHDPNFTTLLHLP